MLQEESGGYDIAAQIDGKFEPLAQDVPHDRLADYIGERAKDVPKGTTTKLLTRESGKNFMPEEGKISIEPWSEESDSYDPWEVADKAEKAFIAAGLRPMRDKDLGLVAFGKDGEPIGATYYKTTQEDASERGGPEGENVVVYEFDIGIDPKHQGGTVGYMLTKKSIDEARSQDADVMRNWVINPKMADMMESLFGFEHEKTPQTRDGYSTHMVKYLKGAPDTGRKDLPRFMPETSPNARQQRPNPRSAARLRMAARTQQERPERELATAR